MTADPLDPGAMRVAAITLTRSQLQQLGAAVEAHAGSVRIEELTDAYARVVLIGSDGEPVSERPLFPT
jgi:hypothetical protein